MNTTSNKLSILFLTNRGPLPIDGGQPRRTYNILKGLAKKNNVYLLSLYERPEEIEKRNIKHLESFCRKVEMIRAPSKRPGIPMIFRLFCSIFSKDPYTIWRHYSKVYLNRVYELVSNEKFDLIHCDCLPLSYTVRNLKNYFRVLTDHDVSYLKSYRMAKKSSNPFLSLFLFYEALKVKRLERNIFTQVDLGIAVSDFDKQYLTKLCPQGIFEVIENGVDTKEFQPSSKKTSNHTILWLGGFGHLPNIEAIYYLIDNIYYLIKKEISGVQLHLIGGEIPKRLMTIADNDSSIKLHGFVDNPLPYLAKSSVFIAPILSGSGTRLKLLEAMAMEKAIVTTSIGCEGIEGENGEHFLIADSPKEFAAKTIELLNNQLLRDYLGSNARKLAREKYDWNKICAETDNIYKYWTCKSHRKDSINK